MKQLHMIAVIVVTLLLSNSGCGSSNPTQAEIERVLKLDIAQKETMPQEADFLVLHDWTTKYLKFVDTLDMRRCPPEFQQSYLEHQLVFRDLNKYLQRIRDRREAGFLATMTLLADDVFGDTKRFNEKLESTWRDVERSATKFGVKVKQVDVQPFVSP